MSENDDSLNTIVSISGSWDFTGEQVYQPSSPGFELSAQRTTKSDLVQMEVLNVALNPSGKVIVQIMAENLSDRYIGVRMDQVCLNNCKVSSGIHHGLLPRARHLFELSLSTGSLLMMDALPLEEIRLQAEIVDRLTSRPLETTPELTLSLTKLPPVPLYSSQGVSISLLAGFSQDLSYYSKGNLEYSLLLENQTRSAVQLAVSGAQINGQEVPVYDLMNVGPGSYCVDQLDIFENGWSELGIRRLESVVVDLEIWSVDKRTRLALIEDVVLYSAP